MVRRLEQRHPAHREPRRLTADGVVVAVAVAAVVVADLRAQTVLHQL